MEKNIIGYFHICQKPGWEQSFDIIFEEIKNSGLYNASKEIRCGIVNDEEIIILNDRLQDLKLKILFCKSSKEYERPTLYHMRNFSEKDPKNTVYWYVHSKGISHFGTFIENNVIDWIKLLLYWNIKQWKLALNMLNYYDTYGCNKMEDYRQSKNPHYSGNFWWANINHIKTLPTYIDEYYNGPEDWICTNYDRMCAIYTSTNNSDFHYNYLFSKDNYEIPDDFNIDIYRIGNFDICHLKYDELIKHYLSFGKFENRIYKVPENLDMNSFIDGKIIWEYFYKDEEYCYNELGNYTKSILPDDFDYEVYKQLNSDLSDFNEEQAKNHYINYGRLENRIYKMI